MDKIINSFVYQHVLQTGMPNPNIPAYMSETYGQCYEDIIIDSMIRAHVKTNGSPNGITYIEVGANHPVCCSTNFLLQKRYGITGILVEANPALVPALQKYRPNDQIINKAVVDNNQQTVDFYISANNETSSLDDRFVSIRTPGIEEKITVSTIRMNTLLEIVKPFDLVMLSIDVEGYDLQLLKDIDFVQYRPFIIQVEPSEDYSPGNTQDIIDFLASNNYELVAETDVNLIFKTK
jgi:FkbM family methyltransferase